MGGNFVSTLAPPFLIGSSSFLQVTRTTIKAWMSSNLGRIPPLTSELAALERLKKTSYNLVSTLGPSFFYLIFFILAGNQDIYNISDEFEFQPDLTKDCGVSCPLASEKNPIDL